MPLPISEPGQLYTHSQKPRLTTPTTKESITHKSFWRTKWQTKLLRALFLRADYHGDRARKQHDRRSSRRPQQLLFRTHGGHANAYNLHILDVIGPYCIPDSPPKPEPPPDMTSSRGPSSSARREATPES